MSIERRYIASTLELRSGEGENDLGCIRGLAARYYRGNKAHQSQDLGGFFERLAPGAFTRVLKKNPDVRILFNHDKNLILGRTSSGTAQVWEESDGLHYSCNLGKQTYAQDLRESIKRGDISQCSFAFSMDPDDSSEDWTEEVDEDRNKRCIIRTISDVSDLLDCSPVCDPAYLDTECDARSYFPEGIPVSVRSHTKDTSAVNSFLRNQRRRFIDRIVGS